MRKHIILLTVFAALHFLWISSAYCWEVSSAANVLIFSDTEVTASYHLDDWTTAADAGTNTLFHQHWQAGSPPTLLSEDQTSITINPGEIAEC